MPQGTIKKKMEKGFGFISPTEGGDDLFFHHSSCGGQFDMLQEGQTVSFDVEQSPKGPRATNVVAYTGGETNMTGGEMNMAA